MGDRITETVLAAFADIENRLETIGPPGLACADTSGEIIIAFLPAFFEGMQQFDSDIFPDEIQQFIVAAAYKPVIQLSSESRGKNACDVGVECIMSADIATKLWPGMIGHCGNLSPERVAVWPSVLPDEDRLIKYDIRAMRNNYSSILNRHGLNRLNVPETFSSLDLYIFFKRQGPVNGAVLAASDIFFRQIIEGVNAPLGVRKTASDIADVVSHHTGLPVESPIVEGIISRWALRERAGIFVKEQDHALAEIFFEAVQLYGHMGVRSFNNGVDKLCYDRGVPGIKTPALVPKVIAEILGSYFYEIMDGLEKYREPEAKGLKKLETTNFSDITRHINSTEVRQLFKDETLGTGERTSSSFRHGTMYNNPTVRRGKSWKNEPK